MEMPAAKFRVRFFELLDEIAESEEEVVITKHGKPIARVVPYQRKPKASIIGCMAGTGRIVGDLDAPLFDDQWEPAVFRRFEGDALLAAERPPTGKRR